MTRIFGGFILVLSLCVGPAPASAQELSGPCPVGQKVADRNNKTGVVVDTDPVGCHVQFPDGTKAYYLSWMLHLAGKPIIDPKDVAAIKPGRYTCTKGLLTINIKSAKAYTDGVGTPGAYSYDSKTQLITFHSGSFKGQYAKYLGKQGIGVASEPTTFFATVCDLGG